MIKINSYKKTFISEGLKDLVEPVMADLDST